MPFGSPLSNVDLRCLDCEMFTGYWGIPTMYQPLREIPLNGSSRRLRREGCEGLASEWTHRSRSSITAKSMSGRSSGPGIFPVIFRDPFALVIFNRTAHHALFLIHQAKIYYSHFGNPIE